MDKKIAAERIRARLEKRLATFLACEVGDLPRLRLGELVHTSFLLWGDGEEMGGFNPTMHAMTQILSREILWELPKAEEAETPEGGNQLMCEVTLDQMGKEISAAIRSLTLVQRKVIGELLLSELRKPVGTLRRGKAHE